MPNVGRTHTEESATNSLNRCGFRTNSMKREIVIPCQKVKDEDGKERLIQLKYLGNKLWGTADYLVKKLNYTILKKAVQKKK